MAVRSAAAKVSSIQYIKYLLSGFCRFFLIYRISLNTITLRIESPEVYTSQGVPISVVGVAQVQKKFRIIGQSRERTVRVSNVITVVFLLQVKVEGQNKDMLHAACEQFLGKSEEEIKHVALETLEGHQRAIMGSMTVEV